MTLKTTLRALFVLLLGAVGPLVATSCGGSSKSTQGAGGSGGSGALPGVGSCENPVPVRDTGWVACDNGVLHRESAGACPLPPVAPTDCGDCFGAPYPWCLPFGFATSICVPGCATDADCGPGAVCFCQGDAPGRCVQATCTTDADCGDGSLCATYEGPPEPACSYLIAGVACQSPRDQCAGDECNCVLKDDRRECQPGIGGCSGG
jgi:hypothetical protein